MGDVAIAAAISAATATLNTMQQSAQARQQQRAQQAAMNRQIEEARMKREIDEKRQRDAMKRRRAAARAGFGARGVASSGGSANALLEGIAADTEEAIADNRRLSEFGIETLRENQRAQQRQSMLATRNSIFNTVVGTAGRLAPSAFNKPN